MYKIDLCETDYYRQQNCRKGIFSVVSACLFSDPHVTTVHHGMDQSQVALSFPSELFKHVYLGPILQPLSCKHTERQAADLHWVYADAWEWIWDPFWSFTMHSNGTLSLDARCGYTLTLARFQTTEISYFKYNQIIRKEIMVKSN